MTYYGDIVYFNYSPQIVEFDDFNSRIFEVKTDVLQSPVLNHFFFQYLKITYPFVQVDLR